MLRGCKTKRLWLVRSILLFIIKRLLGLGLLFVVVVVVVVVIVVVVIIIKIPSC